MHGLGQVPTASEPQSRTRPSMKLKLPHHPRDVSGRYTRVCWGRSSLQLLAGTAGTGMLRNSRMPTGSVIDAALHPSRLTSEMVGRRKATFLRHHKTKIGNRKGRKPDTGLYNCWLKKKCYFLFEKVVYTISHFKSTLFHLIQAVGNLFQQSISYFDIWLIFRHISPI